MTLTTQFLTIIAMIAGGVYLGAAIDTFRRFEPIWKKRILFSFTMEVCFWLLQTLILFYLLYVVNQGELRFYILLALICGYAMYKGMFEKLYKRLLEYVIKIIISIYNFLYRFVQVVIIRPIRFLLKALIAVILWAWGVIVWLVILLLKIIGYPILLLFKGIWRILPQNAKKYFVHFAGFYSKIKNTIIKWWKYIRSKRG